MQAQQNVGDRVAEGSLVGSLVRQPGWMQAQRQSDHRVASPAYTSQEAATYLKAHGELGPYKDRMCSKEMYDELIKTNDYKGDQKRFMSE